MLVECHAVANTAGDPTDDWLAKWPLPFSDLRTAREFFASQRMDPDVWVQVLEHGDSGYRPKFRAEDIRAIATHLAAYDYRTQCARITAPTLVIAGSRSWLDRDNARDVAELIPNAQFVEIPAAGHDVHLDAPDAFRDAVSAFVGGSAS